MYWQPRGAVLRERSILTFSTCRLFGPLPTADAVLSTPSMMLWRLLYDARGAQHRADCPLRSLREEVLTKHKGRPAVAPIHNKCAKTINPRLFDVFVPCERISSAAGRLAEGWDSTVKIRVVVVIITVRSNLSTPISPLPLPPSWGVQPKCSLRPRMLKGWESNITEFRSEAWGGCSSLTWIVNIKTEAVCPEWLNTKTGHAREEIKDSLSLSGWSLFIFFFLLRLFYHVSWCQTG